MNAENIGKYLKKLRVKHNYTQEELADVNDTIRMYKKWKIKMYNIVQV